MKKNFDWLGILIQLRFGYQIDKIYTKPFANIWISVFWQKNAYADKESISQLDQDKWVPNCQNIGFFLA